MQILIRGRDRCRRTCTRLAPADHARGLWGAPRLLHGRPQPPRRSGEGGPYRTSSVAQRHPARRTPARGLFRVAELGPGGAGFRHARNRGTRRPGLPRPTPSGCWSPYLEACAVAQSHSPARRARITPEPLFENSTHPAPVGYGLGEARPRDARGPSRFPRDGRERSGQSSASVAAEPGIIHGRPLTRPVPGPRRMLVGRSCERRYQRSRVFA